MAKKLLKILGIIIAILLVCFVLLVLYMNYLNQSITGDDGVAKDYATKLSPSGTLEQRYTKPGPYRVAHHTHRSDSTAIKEYHIYAAQRTAPGQTFPLVLMVNGTATYASTYAPIFEHLASWGFVVIGNEDGWPGTGATTSTMLDTALELNTAEDSPIKGFINTSKIGIAGHSQGGAGAINAATKYGNSNRYTSLYTASAVGHGTANGNNWHYDTSKLKTATYMMAGTGPSDNLAISPLGDLQQNFRALSTDKPSVIARRKTVGHKDVLEYGDAYMTAWFLWTLSDNTEAKAVFAGDNAELRHNSDWQDVETKHIQ